MTSHTHTLVSLSPEICQARVLRRLVSLEHEAQLWEIRACSELAGTTDDELTLALNCLVRQKIVDSRIVVEFRLTDRGRNYLRIVVVAYYSIQRRPRGGT